MGVLFAMAIKDLRLLVRDRAGAFLVLAWPLIVAVFFGALGPIGSQQSSRVEVALVDEDDSDASRAYAARIETSDKVDLVEMDRAQAETTVAAGDMPAYVVLPEGFSRSQVAEASETARVELRIDPRKPAIGGVMRGLLTEHAHAGASPISIEMSGVSQASSGLPPNPFTVTFTQGIIWAVLACAATFGISLVNERQQGTLLRLCVAPISRSMVLAGKALACFLAILGVSAGLLLVGVLAFGMNPDSWGLLAMALFSVAVAFVGVMMALAVIGRTAHSAAGLSWAILMGLAMLGGGMLPIFMMPPWLQKLAVASPVNWALLAMEGAIWRGWGFEQVATWSAALIGLGVVFFALGARAFRYH